MKRTIAGASTMLVLAVLAGCATHTNSAVSAVAGASAGATPAQIVSTRCTRCHPLDRIKAAGHGAAAWKVTIDRMRGKGAQLSDAEEQQVIDFLARGGAASL
jgi:cytochrome c5